jgi:hypothetical protein
VERKGQNTEKEEAQKMRCILYVICIPCCSITEYVACMRTNNNNIILLCTHIQVVRGHSPE